MRCYAGSLLLYFTYLQQREVDCREVGLDDLAAFVHWLKLPHGSTKVSPGQPFVQARANRSINLHLAAIAGFYDYLWRSGVTTDNVNERLRCDADILGGRRRYKGFLHHLAQTQPVEKRLLRQPEPQRRPKTLSKKQIEQLGLGPRAADRQPLRLHPAVRAG
ncbi:MAG: site-specific integrase [Chloroflexota bacterium]